MKDWFEQLFNRLFHWLPEKIFEWDVDPYFWKLVFMGLVVGLIAAAVLLALLASLNKYKNGKWTVPGKSLTRRFCLIWLAGFIIYDIGMYSEGPISLFTNAPMAVIHAFEMFILESDVAAIHDPFHENWFYMFLFSLVHLMAAGVSLIFVIKHFGFNIFAGFRMFMETHRRNGDKKDTYVFWGMNDPSYLLAKSIKQNYSNDDDYRIIVVRTGSDGDSTSVRNGLERLFNFLSLKNKDLERLRELGCLTTSTFTDLSKLNVSDLRDSGQAVDLFRTHLDLCQLAKILSLKTTENIHLFFLGDDAASNIQSITNLKADETILDFVKGGESRKVKFYCRARYNSVHRVIEDDHLLENIEVKVVDSSHISIEQLKQNVELHPVNYVNIEKDATVSSPFNALVVGFGEVGIDAVRFLYEFGAFVKHGTAKGGKVERSDFHCNVVDARMPVIAGPFLANAPAITTELMLKDGTKIPRRDTPDTDATPLLSLHELDMKGVVFFKKLEDWVKTLNYVVIAANDDEQNMALAVRIFKLAVRYRPDMEHFRILVCVKDDDDGHIRRTAEHYNRLWAAEQVGRKNGTPLHQKEVPANEHTDAPITVFGLSDTIYTYEYIVSDELEVKAREFKDRYDRSIAALRQQLGEPVQKTDTWDDEYKDLMQLTEGFIGKSPTFSGMMRLRRIQSQNLQNCFHQFTKQRMALLALGDSLLKVFSSKSFFRKDNDIKYTWMDGAQPIDAVVNVLDVLARTEHLRWCASHEILGYRDVDEKSFKDEAKLLHGCIKPWEELTQEIQSYDYNIVDVSLGIVSSEDDEN